MSFWLIVVNVVVLCWLYLCIESGYCRICFVIGDCGKSLVLLLGMGWVVLERMFFWWMLLVFSVLFDEWDESCWKREFCCCNFIMIGVIVWVWVWVMLLFVFSGLFIFVVWLLRLLFLIGLFGGWKNVG